MTQPNHRTTANLLMTYASQLDHFLLANDATLDLWADELAGLDPELGKDIIKRFYQKQMPHERMTITPRYIRTEAQRRIRRALGPNAYCQDHRDYLATTCPVCRDEISKGQRSIQQQGQLVTKKVPPPAGITADILSNALKNV